MLLTAWLPREGRGTFELGIEESIGCCHLGKGEGAILDHKLPRPVIAPTNQNGV